eukprot:s3196_g6.t1
MKKPRIIRLICSLLPVVEGAVSWPARCCRVPIPILKKAFDQISNMMWSCLPSSPTNTEKSKRITALLVASVILAAVLLNLQPVSCLDRESPNSLDLLNSWRLGFAAPAESEASGDSVGMVTLFVAGVLTKSISRLLSSEQLLWVTAL